MQSIIKKAFTLIELLVVIAIIGILSGLIIITMSGVTQKANIAKAQVFSNSLRNALMLNLVSEWKFDGSTADGSPATANDVLDTWGSSNGAVPTPPTVKKGANCVSGSCLQFSSASGQYVNIPNLDNLRFSTGTVSFWFKSSATYGAPFFFSDKDVNNKYMGISIGNWTSSYSDESIGFFCYGSSNLEFYYRGGHTLYLDNNWHNVTVTVGSNYNNIYMDGQKLTILTYGYGNASTGGIFSNDPSYDTLRIGSRLLSSYNDGYTGLVDDVRIYGAAIPTSQIREQYYAGLNILF